MPPDRKYVIDLSRPSQPCPRCGGHFFWDGETRSRQDIAPTPMATTTTGPSRNQSAISQIGEAASCVASTKSRAGVLGSDETIDIPTTSFLKGDGKVLKRGWPTIATFTNTEDAVMRKLIFSTGTIGMAFAVAALVAWSHSVTPLQATTAPSSINATEMMAAYKAPLPIEGWEAI